MKSSLIRRQYKLDMIGRILVASPARLSRSCTQDVLAPSSHVLTPAYRGTLQQGRFFSQQQQQQQKPQSFIGKFVDNLKQEYEKNREMKQSLEKFKQEAEKLEQSEALRTARAKYERLESETSDANRVLHERLESLRSKLGDAMDEAQKLEIIKKATEMTQTLNRQARQGAESMAQSGQKLGQSATFQNIKQTARAVSREIDDSTIGSHRVYTPPAVLRMRKEKSDSDAAAANIAPDTESIGIELHKDSKFYASWENFKNNNAYVNKVLDWKMRYDESDNALARASRLLTEKVSDLMGGLFQRTELSEVLTEICRIDPSFTKESFLRQCERDVIPTVLEAMLCGELDILRDWCHEAAYRQLSEPLLTANKLGYRQANRVLDLDQVELAMGKMMDPGPVLIITFTAQQIHCVRDALGNVVDGDPQKVWRVHYVWVLCRDQSELDPLAAWRLMEMSASSREQLV